MRWLYIKDPEDGFFFHWGPFDLSLAGRVLWFRLWGRGVAIKDVRRHPLLFSQRNNLGPPAFKLGFVHVSYLPAH